MGFRESNANVKPMKYERPRILAILKANRAKHKEQYEKAKKVFREEVIREAEEVIKKAKRGAFDKTSLNAVGFQIRVPEQHLEEYDQAIQMLELSVDGEIEIDGYTFGCYVMDKWEWSGSFVSNTLSYANTIGHPKKRKR